MPTYEYQCKSCSHRFEVWQKMADEPLTVCPECQGAIRRVLFPAGIVFKGSGFYKTDHGTGRAPEEAAHKASGEGKEAEAKAEGGSEKKDGNGESKTGGGESKTTPKPEGKSGSSESKASVGAD